MINFVWEKNDLAAEDLHHTCPEIPKGIAFLIRRHIDKDVAPGPYYQVCNLVKTADGVCTVKALLSLRDFVKHERLDVEEFGRKMGFHTGYYERFKPGNAQAVFVTMWKDFD